MSLTIYKMLYKLAKEKNKIIRSCLTCTKPFMVRKNEFHCTWCSGKSKGKPKFKNGQTRCADNEAYYIEEKGEKR